MPAHHGSFFGGEKARLEEQPHEAPPVHGNEVLAQAFEEPGEGQGPDLHERFVHQVARNIEHLWPRLDRHDSG